MADATDPEFYNRADALIGLANQQLGASSRGQVSASMMYAAARFNAWVSACGFGQAQAMREARQETVDYFVKQYRAMLEENLDDYIAGFDRDQPPPGR